jgi:ribosomal protein S3AE
MVDTKFFLVLLLQAEEAKVKILEVTGDRVDNLSKLEVIKQEEEIIQREKEELKKEELAEKLMKEKAAAGLTLSQVFFLHSLQY